MVPLSQLTAQNQTPSGHATCLNIGPEKFLKATSKAALPVGPLVEEAMRWAMLVLHLWVRGETKKTMAASMEGTAGQGLTPCANSYFRLF